MEFHNDLIDCNTADAHPSTERDVYQYDGSHIEDGIASKITRYICIGLLCVPEDFADIPKMPSVLFMLDMPLLVPGTLTTFISMPVMWDKRFKGYRLRSKLKLISVLFH